ncbi:MAG: amidohydrolase [Oscillospiraceae bacterium]|jgi:imidazolonepropionase-like amidohydrolase|nr:amidohydrolase [Oscillospiraceae bacterium]
MLLIKNAKLLTMAAKDYPGGADMLVNDGVIVSIGTNLPESGARVVDASGLTALPGLIDAHCHIGMWEDSIGWAGSDGNEMTKPITPEMRALDAVNPEDRCFADALKAGVTLAATGPGSANVIGGQFIAMRTAGTRLDDMLVKEPLALKIAFGENPKRCYGESQKKEPMTRMATAALLRQALVDAQSYQTKLSQAGEDKRPDRNLGKEILAAALSGGLRVKAHAHRADDIRTALRIRDEFHLNMTLEHCTEGWRILDALRSAQCPVILGPLFGDRSKEELRNMTYEAPSMLHKAGIRFAMMTDHPVIPLEYLPVTVAVAVRYGLPQRAALEAITINAAWAIGLDDRFGSLEPGKEADFALYDGDPLDTRTRVKQVYVRGLLAHEG